MKLSLLSSAAWWKDAGKRAAYTALAVAVPYLGASLLADVPWITVLLTAALAFLASIVTSLAGLPEVEGVNLPWWLAAVERVVKTFAQSLAAGFVGATLITDVEWAFVLQAALIAALGSLVRLILATLPGDPTASKRVSPSQSIDSVSVEMVDSGTAPRVDITGEGDVRRAHFKVPRGLLGMDAASSVEAVSDYVDGVDGEAPSPRDQRGD